MFKKKNNINNLDEDVLELVNDINEELDQYNNDKKAKVASNVSVDSMTSPYANHTNKKDKKSGLVSEDAAFATSAIFRQLQENSSASRKSNTKTDGSITLETLVSELVKPYLAEWLSEHLPGIVKQAVDKEISRLREKEDEYSA